MAENENPASGITEQLQNWSAGQDTEADEALINLVYTELHRQAHRYLQKERAGHTLQTTGLVNEAYLKLIGQKSVTWKSRSHFFAIASTLMRRILIDYAKSKQSKKRGGGKDELALDDALTIAVGGETDFDLIALDKALKRLAEKDAELARIVELRFFSGLDVPQTAEVLGVSESTVKREWAMAKAWLHRELTR